MQIVLLLTAAGVTVDAIRRGDLPGAIIAGLTTAGFAAICVWCAQ